jgi:hypothetical protein
MASFNLSTALATMESSPHLPKDSAKGRITEEVVGRVKLD